jgi:hypothetical protein
MWGPLLKNTKVSQVEAQAAAPVKKKRKKNQDNFPFLRPRRWPSMAIVCIMSFTMVSIYFETGGSKKTTCEITTNSV